jgi:hypothetical protein
LIEHSKTIAILERAAMLRTVTSGAKSKCPPLGVLLAKPAPSIRRLFQWFIQNRQRYTSELNYVPLPSGVAEKSLVAVNSIRPGS